MSIDPHSAEAVSGTVFDDESTTGAQAYAQALINAAEKEGSTEAVLEELDAIDAEILRKMPRMAEILTTPMLSEADRDRILIDAFEGRALPIITRFLRVLNRHGRLALLPAVVRTARSIWDRRQNRIPVQVRSAQPLDERQRSELLDRLARMIGATPILHLSVDPSLLGGIVIQVGDNLYDVSVRNRLEQLRHRLIEGRTHEIQSRRDRFSHSE